MACHAATSRVLARRWEASSPEFIPILGPLDDVVVAVLVLRYVRRQLGIEALRARWRGTPEGFTLLRSVMG